MTVSRESVMTALMNKIAGAIASGFTGNTTAGGPITGIASTAGLFAGLAVVGGSINGLSFIQSIDSPTQITLTNPPSAPATGVSFKTGFLTTGRRVQLWSQTASQPALFLRNVDDDYTVRDTQPPRRTMNVQAWIYSKGGANPDAAPGVALNNLLDAIDTALQPDSPLVNRLTLGNLVYSCRIDGKITYDPGDLDGQAKAIIPISIVLP